MKFDTLIARYTNLGYVPLNLKSRLELENLIYWIYDMYNIYIYATYYDKITQDAFNKRVNKKHKLNYFGAHMIWQCKTENSHAIYNEVHFDNPLDAKFHTVKELYSAIKAQFH